MISIQVKDQKHFMNTLLSTETFDNYLVKEVGLVTFATYHITPNISENPILFSQMRTVLFDLIKGKKAPESFKIILHLSKEDVPTLSSEYVGNYVVTIKYAQNEITLITGVSYQSFTLDKSADDLCDKFFIQFLESHEINYI